MLYSVLLEWENVRQYSPGGRECEVLRRLARQMRQVEHPGEVLLIYDRYEVDEAALRRVCRENMGDVESRFIPASTLHYYQLKNEGVRHARGSIVVMLDSDVLPEENWLPQMLKPYLDDQAIRVVAGSPYVEGGSAYGKAMAACWMFPLRPDDGPISVTRNFYANSVSFRKEVAERFPFPDETKRYRGQCADLARRLTTEGVTIYLNPNARVSHPPPEGVRGFVRRALWHGNDEFYTNLYRRKSKLDATLISMWSVLRRTATIPRRVLRARKVAGLPATQVPLASAIGIFLYALTFAGVILTALQPNFCHRHCSMDH